MKKDRQKLEDALNLVLEDYSNDTKIIEKVADKLTERGISRGRVNGIFTQSIPLQYVLDDELCVLTKTVFSHTHDETIKPDDYYNETELQNADLFKVIEEKTTKIVLHYVDQIGDNQWICTKEDYQNVGEYINNSLITYNKNTQRQPLIKKSGGKVYYVPNIKQTKVDAMVKEMVDGTFNSNVITWNIRKINGMEKFIYKEKERTLTIEIDGENTFVDVIDGANRSASIVKALSINPEINRTTLIMIYHVDEEKARQIIFQEAKAEPLEEDYVKQFDTSDPNLEVVKNINSRQRMNEMFNKIGLNEAELRREENKLVTFDTLSKTIEYIYNLKEKPVIEASNVEEFLVKLFNVVIGSNYEAFTNNISETKDKTYLASNNAFIGYIALGEELKQKYPSEWQEKLQEILSQLDFSKTNSIWKENGLENNLNLSTIKKITKYFKSLIN